MFTIAIILFPGLNTESETKRAVEQAGMTAALVRWNDNTINIAKFEGYIIGGGFAYEDRGRAGLIASKDPLMQKIKQESLKGKPVLGICNGAQILVESGLIPGSPNQEPCMCVARNKRVKNERVLGTGYYNVWVNLKSTAPQKRCAFNYSVPEGAVLKAPIAHGEGRFITAHASLFPQLIENRQIVFRYCDTSGVITDEFPVNPNGASYNTAAICNPAGNVMAIMPHGERGFSAPIPELFASMKAYLFDRKRPVYLVNELKLQQIKELPSGDYIHPTSSFEIISKLIINDNEAETIQSTARKLGFQELRLKKFTHFKIKSAQELSHNDIRRIIQSGELANANKETVYVKTKSASLKYDHDQKCLMHENWPLEKCVQLDETDFDRKNTFQLLVREKEDFIGQSKTQELSKIFPTASFAISRSIIWIIEGLAHHQEFERLCRTYLLYSPHSQQFVYYS